MGLLRLFERRLQLTELAFEGFDFARGRRLRFGEVGTDGNSEAAGQGGAGELQALELKRVVPVHGDKSIIKCAKANRNRLWQ